MTEKEAHEIYAFVRSRMYERCIAFSPEATEVVGFLLEAIKQQAEKQSVERDYQAVKKQNIWLLETNEDLLKSLSCLAKNRYTRERVRHIAENAISRAKESMP